MSKYFYLTTTLPYVNADPHIGFALEIIQADIVARHRRLSGAHVFFNTGTDEHGQKVLQKAKEAGEDIRTYVDRYAARFQNLKEGLGLSYDAFIRTTNPGHFVAAQELWKRCANAGDIYKKKYKGLYCVGDEAFVRASDLVSGRCPNHPDQELIEIEEENYFFRLSAYQGKLLEYLSREGVVIPGWRRAEAIAFVSQGLEDFSISREKARMSWGIPVPNDGAQVMYVWFDALTNYISTLGWPHDPQGNFEKFWSNGVVLQFAGKDQVRFQSIMWQAMLMSAGIKTTDHVMYHGFITSGGQKMSKSIGNVIDPLALVREYGTDAVRYYLARHVQPFEDSDFTLKHFKESYNAELANGLGNLAARVFTMAANYEAFPRSSEFYAVRQPMQEAWAHLEAFNFSRAMERVWNWIADVDKFITDEKPFALFKRDPQKARSQVHNALSQLRDIAVTLEPVLPHTSREILSNLEHKTVPTALFPRKE